MLTHSCQDELLAYAARLVSASYSHVDIKQGRHLVWSGQAVKPTPCHGRTDGRSVLVADRITLCLGCKCCRKTMGFVGLLTSTA